MMSELSREQVEAHLDVLDCSLSPKASKDSKLKLLATDAALRAKLDEQTKRVEKAERELGIRQEAFSRATQRHIAKCVTIADITAKLEAMTQDRNAYQKIAADWASAADLSQQADDFYEGYSEKTMRAMQALLTRSQQQLAASEQRFQAAENERIEWVQRGERAEQRVRELEESQLAWGAELSRAKPSVDTICPFSKCCSNDSSHGSIISLLQHPSIPVEGGPF